LHLRTLEEACVDELAGDLALSGGTEAAPLARDLWISGSEERLRKTDGIALVNQDGMVLDAVLFSEYLSGDWLKEELVQFSSLLANAGAWTRRDQQAGAPQPQDAAMSGTATTTRTICRDESASDTNSAADWYVTVASGATPGLPNRTERYTETAKTARYGEEKIILINRINGRRKPPIYSISQEVQKEIFKLVFRQCTDPLLNYLPILYNQERWNGNYAEDG